MCIDKYIQIFINIFYIHKNAYMYAYIDVYVYMTMYIYICVTYMCI